MHQHLHPIFHPGDSGKSTLTPAFIMGNNTAILDIQYIPRLKMATGSPPPPPPPPTVTGPFPGTGTGSRPHSASRHLQNPTARALNTLTHPFQLPVSPPRQPRAHIPRAIKHIKRHLVKVGAARSSPTQLPNSPPQMRADPVSAPPPPARRGGLRAGRAGAGPPPRRLRPPLPGPAGGARPAVSGAGPQFPAWLTAGLGACRPFGLTTKAKTPNSVF